MSQNATKKTTKEELMEATEHYIPKTHGKLQSCRKYKYTGLSGYVSFYFFLPFFHRVLFRAVHFRKRCDGFLSLYADGPTKGHSK